MRLHAFVASLAFVLSAASAEVAVVRVPDGGFKASALVDAEGTLHLVYFKGEPSGGDAYYATSHDGGATFAKAVRVNSQPGSVLGGSSARGPHLALGREGRAHVLWPGAREAQPPGALFYARLDGAAFTPQRNLMRRTTALDGDSAIATDRQGRVYVAWHAVAPGTSPRSEADRAVWLARSEDDGATFAEEANILPEQTGVCACCALAMNAAPDGSLAILYRVATERTHRGMRLLLSRDRGVTFTGRQLDEWQIAMCPMSTAALLPARAGFLGAWENAGAIRFATFPGDSIPAPGAGPNRKHPSLAVNARGETLLAWSEGTSFARGGDVAWQVFDAKSHPLGEPGHARGLPANGNPAAVALPDGRFLVIY